MWVKIKIWEIRKRIEKLYEKKNLKVAEVSRKDRLAKKLLEITGKLNRQIEIEKYFKLGISGIKKSAIRKTNLALNRAKKIFLALFVLVSKIKSAALLLNQNINQNLKKYFAQLKTFGKVTWNWARKENLIIAAKINSLYQEVRRAVINNAPKIKNKINQQLDIIISLSAKLKEINWVSYLEKIKQKIEEPPAEELMPLSELAKESVYKKGYLVIQARIKKLKAQKVNGVWQSTKRWLDEFVRESLARNEKIRKKLSREMFGEQEGRSIASLKSDLQAIWQKNDFAKAGISLIILVFLMASTNAARANLETMRQETLKKLLIGYNFTIDKIAEVAKPFEGLKVSRDLIGKISREIEKRNNIKKFEDKSNLSLTGKEEDKNTVVETDGGIVAGEANQGVQDGASQDQTQSIAGNLVSSQKLTAEEVLAVLDHNLSYKNFAEHGIRRRNLNSNAVTAQKIADGSIKSADLGENIEIQGSFTVHGDVVLKGPVELGSSSYQVDSSGIVTEGTWNGNRIDISDYTNLAVSGALLNLTGDTLSINEGALADGKICTYVSDTGLVCTTDLGTLVNYWTASSNDIYKNNSGNVGIGTTSPGAKLEVAGAGYFSSGAYIGAISNNNLIDDSSNGSGSTVLYIGNRAIATTSDLHSALTITAIGASPNANGMTLTGQQLNLEPASISYGGAVTTGTQTFAGAKTFDSAITAPTTANTINSLIINSGALSGITTLSMNNQLTNSYANSAALYLTGAAAGITFTGTGTDQIITAASQNLALMPGGNVGVGTTTPGAKLEVAGAGYFSSGAYIGAISTNNLIDDSTNGSGSTVLYIGNRAIATTSDLHSALTITAIGASPNANGMTLTGQQLNLEPASISYGGAVTTGTQTFAGAKTFDSAITAPTTANTINSLIINSGALSGITTLSMNNQLTNSYANSAALYLTGAAAGITFTGTGTDQIITAASQNLALMPGGNVGIGTTAPGAKLEISGGNLKMTSGNIALNGNWLSGDADNEGIFVDSGGNVGIGITTPQANFDASSTTGAAMNLSRFDTSLTASDTIGQISFWTNDTSTTTNHLAAQIKTIANSTVSTDINPGILTFSTTSTSVAAALSERMRIDSAGNVGIGTTTPGDLFTVGNNVFKVSSAGAISAPTASNTINSLIINAGALSGITTLGMNNQLTNSYANSAALYLTGNAAGITFSGTGTGQIITAASQNLALMPGGNVGIGTTTPKGTFDVNGKMTVIASGNVGIGTTTPGALLDIGVATAIKGVIRLAGNTSGNVTIQPAAAAGTWTMTLPSAGNSNAGYQLTCVAADSITSWAAAGSLRIWKNITGTADPDDALAQILATPVYHFHYKPGMGTGDSTTDYVGVMADEAPWAMHYNGTIVNPVNTLGYMILGMQATNEKMSNLSAVQEVQETAISNQQIQITKQVNDISDLQTAINGQLTLTPDSFASINSSVTQDQQDITSFKTQLDLANTKLKENENNLLTYETTVNDLIQNMMDTETMLTQKVMNYEDRIKALEDKMLVLSVTDSGEIPQNVLTQDKNGNVNLSGVFTVKGIVAGEADIKDLGLDTEIADKGTIQAGDSKVVIKSNKVTKDSKIFVTSTAKLAGSALYVSEDEIKEGESFVVKLDGDVSDKDVTFNWFILK